MAGSSRLYKKEELETMTTKSTVLSATEAMRKLRELNQGTQEVVSERGKILRDFIETHQDEFKILQIILEVHRTHKEYEKKGGYTKH